MNSALQCVRRALVLSLVFGLIGCGGPTSPPLSAQEQQELEQLRAENREVKKLRVENRELERLRREQQELQNLQGIDAEIAKLKAENLQLKAKRATLPASALAAPPPPSETVEAPPLQAIQDLPQAFADAALLLAAQGTPPKPEDIPMKGDNILIDQSVIGLLIPEFQKNTNGGPYEVSGWLSSKGVNLTNYQQLNILGITNYSIRRAPAPPPDSPPK